MSLDAFMTQPVTIVRAAPGDNGYGGNAPDWDNADRTAATAWLTSTSSSEVTDGRDALVSNWKIYLPAGTDLLGLDRIESGDDTFEVVGIPSRAATPAGEHHVEAVLQLVQG